MLFLTLFDQQPKLLVILTILYEVLIKNGKRITNKYQCINKINNYNKIRVLKINNEVQMK